MSICTLNMELPYSLILDALVYLITGCAAGCLAGLFGVGGGIIIVPVLTALLGARGVAPEILMQVVIGTSMAIVTLTGAVSARVHHRNHNVDLAMVKRLLPAVLLGVAGGAGLASHVSRLTLVLCVVAFEVGVAGSFLRAALSKTEKAEGDIQHTPPPAPVLLSASLVLGGISSVVGIAGGTLFVPFLHYGGMGMRRAIGTAAVLGCPVGFIAAVVYVTTGMMQEKPLPDHALGYVYLPAVLGCVLGSLTSTKFGAELAKKMSVKKLKLAFAVVLLAAAAKMIGSAL